MRVVALALERQHGVHHVLQYFRPREASVFRDVAHQHRRHVLPLGGKEKLRGGFPHLPDAARRRLEPARPHRLHRVDDHQRRLEAGDLFEDALDAGLRQEIERRRADAEPVAAALDLVLRLLAGRVEHGADVAGEVRRRLQQQRGLADAGLAAEQHQRSRDDAAAEHAVEFADAGRQPLGLRRLDFAVQPRRALRAELGIAVDRGRRAPPRPRAPRPASSTPRTRCSAPSTWAPARRTPDRRTRLSVISSASGFVAAGLQTRRVRGSGCGSSDPPGLSVLPLDARPQAADDLPRNRADRRRHLARVDALPRLARPGRRG